MPHLNAGLAAAATLAQQGAAAHPHLSDGVGWSLPLSSVAIPAALAAIAVAGFVAAAALVRLRRSRLQRQLQRLRRSSGASSGTVEAGRLLQPALPGAAGAAAGLQHRHRGSSDGGGSGGSSGAALRGRRRISEIVSAQLGEQLGGRGLQMLPPQALSQVLAHHLRSLGRPLSDRLQGGGDVGSQQPKPLALEAAASLQLSMSCLTVS